MRKILLSILILLVIAFGCSTRLVSLRNKAHKGFPSFDLKDIKSKITDLVGKAQSTIGTGGKDLIPQAEKLAKQLSNVKLPNLDSIPKVGEQLSDAAKQAYKEAASARSRN